MQQLHWAIILKQIKQVSFACLVIGKKHDGSLERRLAKNIVKRVKKFFKPRFFVVWNVDYYSFRISSIILL